MVQQVGILAGTLQSQRNRFYGEGTLRNEVGSHLSLSFLGKAVLGAALPGPVQHQGAVVSLPQVEGARSWVPKLLQKTGPEVSGGRRA